MNRLELRTLARQRIDDKVAPYLWDDAFINALLDEAVVEANLRARFLVDSTTPAVCEIAVTAGTITYPLDPSIIVVRRAEWVSSIAGQIPMPLQRRRFDYLDRRNPGWRTYSTTSPFAIVQDLDQKALWLSGMPSIDGTLKLTVWRHPLASETMDDDAKSPVIPNNFHRRLVEYVAYQALLDKDVDAEDGKSAATHLGLFDQEFGDRPDAKKLRQLAVDHDNESDSYF